MRDKLKALMRGKRELLNDLWVKIKKWDHHKYHIENYFNLVLGTFGMVGCIVVILIGFSKFPVALAELRTTVPPATLDWVLLALWIYPVVEVLFVILTTMGMLVWVIAQTYAAIALSDWSSNQELVEKIAQGEQVDGYLAESTITIPN